MFKVMERAKNAELAERTAGKKKVEPKEEPRFEEIADAETKV